MTVLPGTLTGPRKGGPRQIKGAGTGFKGKIDDKYYPPAEYRLFADDQKAKHKGLCGGTKKQRRNGKWQKFQRRWKTTLLPEPKPVGKSDPTCGGRNEKRNDLFFPQVLHFCQPVGVFR